MTAYFNENDPFAAAWLRELIKENLIAPGEVDDRDIKEVTAKDLKGFTQAHFFAGIGVWSYALRQAGWPDARPVWTGSCPCPSFSAAGKRQGLDDPRHLWPHWARLIRECQPATIFGEQVDDAIGFGWLDIVQSDLEARDYAIGKAVFGACDVGAPHIRSRLYFVAESIEARRIELETPRLHGQGTFGTDREPQRMANSECDGGRPNKPWRRSQGRTADGWGGEAGELADPAKARRQQRQDVERSEATVDGEPHRLRIGHGRQLGESHGGIPGNGNLQRSGQYGLFAQDRGIGELADTGLDERRRGERGAQEGAGPHGIGRRGSGSGSALGHTGRGYGSTRPARDVQESCESIRPGSASASTVGNASEPGLSSPECEKLSGAQRNEEGRADAESGPALDDAAGARFDSQEQGPESETRHQARLRGSERGRESFWAGAIWHYCRDGKWRPIPAEPALQPLAARSAGRVGLLRGAGNALCSPAAQKFIEAYIEVMLARESN